MRLKEVLICKMIWKTNKQVCPMQNKHGVSHLVVALGARQRRLRITVGIRVEKCCWHGSTPNDYFFCASFFFFFWLLFLLLFFCLCILLCLDISFGFSISLKYFLACLLDLFIYNPQPRIFSPLILFFIFREGGKDRRDREKYRHERDISHIDRLLPTQALTGAWDQPYNQGTCP